MTEKGNVSIWKACMCVSVSIYVSECVPREGERERREEVEANGWRWAQRLRRTASPPLSHFTHFAFKALFRQPRPSTESPVASSFASTSFPSLALSQKPPISSSLLILPKHIVLFAFHVFKVKVAPGRTFVDVLDVIASGLEVSGGIVGPWCEDLRKEFNNKS